MSAALPHDLPLLGWSNRTTGKPIVVKWQSADGRVAYRYKGSRRICETTRASFDRRFQRSST